MKYKLSLFSDTHNKHKKWFENITLLNQRTAIDFLSADFLIFAGDMTEMGTKSEVKRFFDWLDNLPTIAHKIVVAGNHDTFFDIITEDVYGKNWEQEEIQNLLNSYPNIYYLQDNFIEIEGLKIWGSPWSLPFKNWGFMANEHLMKRVLSKIPEGTHVIITHGPAFNKLDISTPKQRAYDGKIHLGSQEVRNAVERIKPKLHVSGHVHSNYGIWPGIEIPGEIIYVNPSSVNEDYEPLNPPMIVEIEI